jgi:hypothetical protein
MAGPAPGRTVPRQPFGPWLRRSVQQSRSGLPGRLGCYTSALPRQLDVYLVARSPVPPRVCACPQGVTVTYWTEFKNTILPWLLAGSVVAFLVMEHRRTTEALLGANARLAAAVEEQGRALDGVRQLLSAQGYTVPPLNAQQ